MCDMPAKHLRPIRQRLRPRRHRCKGLVPNPSKATGSQECLIALTETPESNTEELVSTSGIVAGSRGTCGIKPPAVSPPNQMQEVRVNSHDGPIRHSPWAQERLRRFRSVNAKQEVHKKLAATTYRDANIVRTGEFVHPQPITHQALKCMQPFRVSPKRHRETRAPVCGKTGSLTRALMPRRAPVCGKTGSLTRALMPRRAPVSGKTGSLHHKGLNALPRSGGWSYCREGRPSGGCGGAAEGPWEAEKFGAPTPRKGRSVRIINKH
eukprot:1184410-Prorocentrum_minimum.AAC.4